MYPKTYEEFEKEIKELKEEVQLRWSEGEAVIQEAVKLRYDIKCLEESTVDRKAWDKICDDKVNLMFKVIKLEKEKHELKGRIKVLLNYRKMRGWDKQND